MTNSYARFRCRTGRRRVFARNITEARCAFLFADALPVNIDEDADAEQAEGEVRAAVADEGQRQSFVGQERRRDADIHPRLQRDEHDHAEAEQQPEIDRAPASR